MLHQPETPLEYRYRSVSPARTLWNLFRGRRGQMALTALLFIVKHSPVWLMPVLFSRVIGVIAKPAEHAPYELWLYLSIMAVLVVQNLFSHVFYTRLLSQLLRRVERSLREALVRRLQHLSIAFHLQHETGRLQTKVLRDVEAVHGLCGQLCEVGLNGTVGVLFALAIAGAKDWRTLLLYLVMTPLAIGLQRFFRTRMIADNQAFRRAIEGMGARVTEMLGMIPVTRAHGLEEEEIRKMSQQLAQVQDRGLRLDVLNAWFAAAAFVSMQLPQLAVLGLLGYYCYTTGTPSVADVILYWGLFQTILGSVNMLIYSYPMVTKGLESLKSIGEVLECPDLELNEGKAKVTTVAGRFEFQDVSFTYPNVADPAVRGLSFTVPAGEHLALVGESGSGKSTIMSLVVGFNRPGAGRILLDGKDMQTLDLRTYRRHLAVIPQETVLFSGTIRDNILYGLEKVPEDHFQMVLDAANIREFVKDLPAGVDTIVGERGARLSGGQRQRLAIARALARDPKVIMMDEATSALDVISEKLVQEALERLLAGRTTFIIAHRLSTIRHAHRVMVLRAGQIVELGTPDELLAKRGEFYQLKSLQ